MAFIEISNPAKRNEIVEDYINTKHQLQEKYENDKAVGLQQRIAFEKQYQPLLKASKESSKDITKELKKNRIIKELDKGYWKPDYAKPALDYYLSLRNNVDKYYGIQKKGNGYVMGDSNVVIDTDSNIIVNDQRFKGTPGLWQLIMLNKPREFTKEDLARYEDLVETTQVIFNPLITGKNDKPKMTVKYKEFLKEMEESYEEETKPAEAEPEALAELESTKPDSKSADGEGIKFLPGNKKGLIERLRLLSAESRAGNTVSTREEIVAILDELLRRREITRKQYNDICKDLLC